MRLLAEFYEKSLDCVHCGLCLQACPTYNLLGQESESPRGRLYLMRQNAEGRFSDPRSIRPHLDRCLGCRACETACPSGVRYGRILEEQRHELEEQWPRRNLNSKLRRWLLAHIVSDQRRLRFAFSLARGAELLGLRKFFGLTGLLDAGIDQLLPRVPPAQERRSLAGSYRPSGTSRGRVHLFTGCIMEQIFGTLNRQTILLLTANGFEVVVPGDQSCCGALQVHNGLAKEAAKLAARNLRAFDDAEIIINNSAGCGAALKEYGDVLGGSKAENFAERCRDICEFLAEKGLQARPAPFPHKVAYDAPCHLHHGQSVVEQPMALLRQVPGLELVSNPSSADCCGSAGIYNLLQPDLAGRIGKQKAASLMTVDAEYVATGNPGCLMQVAMHLRAANSTMKVLHPVEILLP